MLVQEQRFLAATVEHERIAPLQPRDDFALARFFDEQVVDGFLIERLRRGQPDVDLLGVLPRIAEQARMHEVVVNARHRQPQVAKAADADEAWVAGAGPMR